MRLCLGEILIAARLGGCWRLIISIIYPAAAAVVHIGYIMTIVQPSLPQPCCSCVYTHTAIYVRAWHNVRIVRTGVGVERDSDVYIR